MQRSIVLSIHEVTCLYYFLSVPLVVHTMKILNRKEILSLVQSGDLIIYPFDESCLSEITYDIKLADEFVAIETHITSTIDPNNLDNVKRVEIKKDEVYLQPHGFILGKSLEWIELPNDVLAMISGKSGLARLGIQVETAYLLQPGHKGYVVLEINNRNLVPIKLRKNMRIAQLLFFKLDEPVRPYHEIGRFGVQRKIRIL